MLSTPLPPVLQKLEDEIFFAILDVALDIETELLLGSGRILIPVRRLIVRYEILYPVPSIGTMDRYCELRWKASTFLKAQSFIGSAEYREQGSHRWEGLLEITVPDPVRFATLLVDLRSVPGRG